MVTVLISKLDDNLKESFYNHYSSFLPQKMAEKYSRFLKSEDQQRYLIGKLLTIMAMGEKYTLNDVKFQKNRKPYIESDFYFNLSHSGEYVVFALSTASEIGIDIEKITFKDLIHYQNYFSEMEWRSITTCSNPFPKFFELWTIKESVSKAIGDGLHLPFDSIQTRQNTIAFFENTGYHLNKIEISTEYSCHIASIHPFSSVSKNEIRFKNELLTLNELANYLNSHSSL